MCATCGDRALAEAAAARTAAAVTTSASFTRAIVDGPPPAGPARTAEPLKCSRGRPRRATPTSSRSASRATTTTPASRPSRTPASPQVELTSDELTAVCPITGQPDLYRVTIACRPDALCLESKSLKLYLSSFRNEGVFCEALAVQIRDDVAGALELTPDRVNVTLEQKARGGITITAAV